MAKISDTSTYPIVAPNRGDLVIGTNDTDEKTKNFDVGAISDIAVDEHEAAFGHVPDGGTTGQVLAKNSNTDLDTAWVDQTGGGGGAVDSVNGQVGVVVLDAADVGADASGTAAGIVATHAALTTSAHGGIVPAVRTLTINGSALDLSADRAWTVGDVLLGSANTFTLGPNLFKAGADGNIALAARRHSSGATANIFETQDESGASLTYIDKQGRISVGSVVDTFIEYDANNADKFYVIASYVEDAISDYPEYHGITGIYTSVQVNEPGTGTVSGAWITGMGGTARARNGSKAPGRLYGLYFTTQHESTTQTVDRLTAAYIESAAQGPTSLYLATDIYASLNNVNIANAFGIRLTLDIPSAITGSLYGIYIPNIAEKAATAVYAMYTAGGEIRHQTGAAATVGLSVQAATAQSADLLRLVSSDGTTKLAYFDAAGDLFLPTKSANTVFAGPSSGGAARPAFRALVAADLASGGGSGAKYLRDDMTWQTVSGGSGTVTSVNITQPAAGITASGGPITSSGAITLALANDLSALEGLPSTGIAVRTTTDTWAQRTITGTSNRLTVTNGDGVSGDPTLDISSSYVGQASITTLGTIGTGVWQGTLLGATYGGTGVNNGANLLTVPATGTAALLETANVFTALQTAKLADSGTNTVLNVLTLSHNSNGSIAANYGTGMTFRGQSTTTADRDMAAINAIWTTATDGSRQSQVQIQGVTGAGALATALSIRGNGVVVTNNLILGGTSTTASTTNPATITTNSVNLNLLTFSQDIFFTAGFSGESLRLATLSLSTSAVNATILARCDPAGTPSAGFGSSYTTQLKSTTTIDQNASEWQTLWATATHASRKARIVGNVYDTAAREWIRGEADGARANIGLLGASDFGSGSGVIAILNATTAPSATPSGGGVLYVESGALKYKGSSGTVTTLGAA